MPGELRIGFLMDPLDGVRVDHDSTFALMLDCQRRGIEVRELRQEWLFAREGRAWSRMRTVDLRPVAGNHFAVRSDRESPLADLDILFLRKDPPVDVEFLHATQLVEVSNAVVLINHPSGLRDANEKLFAMRFPELIPPTLVAREVDRIHAFVEALGGDGVIKPLDGCGGQGVFRLRRGDPNLSALLETATAGSTKLVVAQAYLPEVKEGDKRVIVLDGEPIGALLRLPPAGELRANLAAGGKAAVAQIAPRDREICRRLAPELRRLGLWLAGIDVIGGRLTEVNVTSPTGLQEIEALSGIRVAQRVIDFAIARARLRGRSAAGM